MTSVDSGYIVGRFGKIKALQTHSSRTSIRVDRAPMVDVTLFLLMFYMLTATLSRHRIMELNSPVGSSQPVQESNVDRYTIAPMEEADGDIFSALFERQQP